MKNSLFIILLVIIAGTFGCKSKKVLTDSVGIVPIDKDLLIKQLQNDSDPINNIFFRRSLIQFESENVSHTFRSNIYIDRNHFIRISILAPMGIEVARVSMEPDSVTIIDRMGRQVIYTDYREIYRKFGVETDFFIFQSILLNEAFSMFYEKGLSLHDYHLSIQRNQYQLSSARERSRSVFSGNNAGFFHKMWIEPDSFEVTRFSFNELDKNMVLDIVYRQFSQLSGGQNFPKKISVTGNRGLKKLSLDIAHSSVEINGDNNISFQVSDKYEKIYR